MEPGSPRYKNNALATEPKCLLFDAVVRDWLYSRSYTKSVLSNYLRWECRPITQQCKKVYASDALSRWHFQMHYFTWALRVNTFIWKIHFLPIFCSNIVNKNEKFTLYLLVLSADNLFKQFGPSTGPTKCWAWSGSNLFDIQMVYLKEFSKRSIL